jgi:hypothetical protein
MGFENDDVIMPDTPIEMESQEIDGESFEAGFNGEEPQEKAAEEQSNKIRFNFEDGEHEFDYDEAVKLAQMGMNLPKLEAKIEALENDPRMLFVKELAEEQGMEVDEFLEAFNESKELYQLNDLVNMNIPEEQAREILEGRKLKEEFKAKEKAQQEDEAVTSELQDFMDFFKESNERNFDVEKDQLPQEVWEAHAQGVPLKFAYVEHQNKQMKAELQTIMQNQQNKMRAPINGTTAYGSNEVTSEDPFLRGFDS